MVYLFGVKLSMEPPFNIASSPYRDFEPHSVLKYFVLIVLILKVRIFYPPIDGAPARFRTFLDIKMTILYEETLYFPFFFEMAILNSGV